MRVHGYKLVIFALGCVLLAGCNAPPDAPAFHPETPAQAAALANFDSVVKPLLLNSCGRCHVGLNHQGGFNMTTRALLLKGGKHGVPVVPGDPEASLLVKLIRHQGPADHPMSMPSEDKLTDAEKRAGKDRLTDAEIATIANWIADGAVMDR